MAATVNIKRWTGASGSMSGTIITSVNTVANAVDAHQSVASSSTDPIKIPTVGTNYSYWVSTRLATGATGPTGTISNLRWYSDGANSFGTGVGCNVKTTATYTQATGTPGVSGTAMSGGSAFTGYSSALPLSVAGSTSSANTDFGDYVVYQLTVETTAVAGVTGSENFTWAYDET